MAEAHEYRRDPMTGLPVILAPGRIAVTQGSDPLAGLPTPPGPCPFCPGNDAALERTVLRLPIENPWRVRVVTNRYPSVMPGAMASGGLGDDPIAASGRQEIVIEAPAHDSDLTTYEAEHRTDVLRVLRDRLTSFEADPSIAEVAVFRNKGRRAGSTQPHPHSQLIGTSIAGPSSALRFERAKRHFASAGETLVDTVLRRELELGERIVSDEPEFVAVTPFAPKEKYEAWILPRHARGSLSTLPDASLASLASILAETATQALAASGRSDYNVLFRLPPVAERSHAAAFWYVEILPRGAGPAGFELVSGVPVVSVTPERAAREIRGANQNARE
jgi:UDPglucose--hexose-1-phosphate uridylyltransferase